MHRKTRGSTTSRVVETAREQRREQTSSEEKLWEALRGGKLAGLKFRRQHPFSHFILDFFCVKYQLAIEVDGGVHSTPERVEYDRLRTQYLETQGVRVLRFKNEGVERDLEKVLNQILEVIHV